VKQKQNNNHLKINSDHNDQQNEIHKINYVYTIQAILFEVFFEVYNTKILTSNIEKTSMKKSNLFE